MNLSASMAERLEEWNDDLSRHLLPDSIILIIYLVIGILGNSCVIYIHTVRLKQNKEDRFFITVLAIVDLVSCVVSTSFSFSINTLPVKYNNDRACKVMFFLNMTCTLASAWMLVAIAVDRYRKICRPFNKQMTMYWKKVCLAVVAGIALLSSWPCFLFYGSKELVDEERQVVGHRCTNVRGPWSNTQPLIFKTTFLLLIAVILVSLVVLYILIGRVVVKQMRFHKKRSAPYMSSDNSNIRDTSQDSSTRNTNCKTDSPGTSDADLSEVDVSPPLELKFPPGEKEVPAGPCGSAGTRKEEGGHSKQHPSNRIQGVRMAMIFILITVVFIISFLPKVGLMVYESRNENFWTELSPSELGGYRFLYTAFIINNIVNPFIYGMFDRRFRTQVIKVFCACGRK